MHAGAAVRWFAGLPFTPAIVDSGDRAGCCRWMCSFAQRSVGSTCAADRSRRRRDRHVSDTRSGEDHRSATSDRGRATGLRLATRSRRREPARKTGRAFRYPLPLKRDPRPIGADRSAFAEPRLPPDSDEATLDAIAANGKPLTLPEAISLAFANQPRLRAQLETIGRPGARADRILGVPAARGWRLQRGRV